MTEVHYIQKLLITCITTPLFSKIWEVMSPIYKMQFWQGTRKRSNEGGSAMLKHNSPHAKEIAVKYVNVGGVRGKTDQEACESQHMCNTEVLWPSCMQNELSSDPNAFTLHNDFIQYSSKILDMCGSEQFLLTLLVPYF